MPWILVADDDEDVREGLAEVLRTRGYEVRTAPDGARAMEAISAGPPPALVLLDLLMPYVSGRDVLQAIARKVPVAVITGIQPSADELGPVAGVFLKPVLLDVLLELVQRYVVAAGS
jgi:CheY-like chemotaxis protein